MLLRGRAKCMKGRVFVPGDKSISHRAVMLLAISEGSAAITGFLRGADCLSTLECLRNLGAQIEDRGSQIIVQGRGLKGLGKPAGILDVGNSGTTMRLLSGILAGQDFASIITGDDSIKARPMDRIAVPLRSMGAKITGREGLDLAPLVVQGGCLQGIDYTLPIASAQVKSAILLAGLYAAGETIVRELIPARNHTELMLEYMGAEIEIDCNRVTIAPSQLEARDIRVPGDISSAAFFMVAAASLPGSHVVIENVGLNRTRTGVIDVLRAMGARIELENLGQQNGELYGDIVVRGSALHGTTIPPEWIPSLVDEVPILAVAASQAEGVTMITGAQELRFKESNR
ncbi:MAG: 3-phosphoshikimate 1-carboxyvinyltransferase, partial [Limnochordia bacterium]|nr:3-phosphoshikimate 1-carboxyvinyltransferase [Limnochordia bacterium]